jgi:hypothetical protein
MKQLQVDQFEFFTFFLGLHEHELNYLEALTNSFPYYDNYKINVIDKSVAVKDLIDQSKPGTKIYFTAREYVVDPTYELSRLKADQFFEKYKNKLNRIIMPSYSFHGEGVTDAIKNYAKSKYVIIMDSDIEFLNGKYLPDLHNYISRYSDADELAAIGTIYQESAFYLPLRRFLLPDFYNLFIDNHKSLSWSRVFSVFKNALKRQFIDNGRDQYFDRRSKLPRFHPLLLMVNRDVFIECNMYFKNIYLEVLDVRHGIETKHRVMGDSGSSFFFQCVANNKKVINHHYEDYVLHERSGSFPRHLKVKKIEWNWFNAKCEDDPHS